MPALLTTASVMQGQHQGLVQVESQNTRVRIAGAFALRATDTFTIVGCIFSTAAGPHPCVRVEWSTTAARSRVVGDPTLTESSLGLCIAGDEAVQGAVAISGVQGRVSGV